MTSKTISDAITNISTEYIEKAADYSVAKKAHKPVWLKWAAMAACLCLVIAGVAIWSNSPSLFDNITERGSGDGGEGTAPDGVLLEGVDSVVASVAVFPAEESLLDVADATAVSVNEEEAKNIERLGAYLPDTLPEGYRYGPAGYFETTMKDGTQYHMIRVTYESGQGAVSAPVSENVQASSEMTGNTAFIWTVWDHCPGKDEPIYQPDEVTPQFLDQMYGSVFFIDYDGVYVGISRYEISTEELMSIIDSID